MFTLTPTYKSKNSHLFFSCEKTLCCSPPVPLFCTKRPPFEPPINPHFKKTKKTKRGLSGGYGGVRLLHF